MTSKTTNWRRDIEFKNSGQVKTLMDFGFGKRVEEHIPHTTQEVNDIKSCVVFHADIGINENKVDCLLKTK